MPNIAIEKRTTELSFRDVYHILFRHKKKAILFFSAVFVTVTLGTFLAPKIYRSEAKLFVRIGRESVTLDPTVTTGQIVSIGQSRENEINSELEILRSRELFEKVVDAIGPAVFLKGPKAVTENTPSPAETGRETAGKPGQVNLLERIGLSNPLEDRERAILTVVDNLKVETQKNTNILFLSYEAENPKLAQDALNKLIEFYLERHIVIHRTAGSYGFFDKEVDQIRNQLTKGEEELKNLKKEKGVGSIEEKRKIVLERIRSLQQEAELTQAALAASKAKVKELKEKLASLSPNVVMQQTQSSSNYGIELIRARLYELRLKEQQLLTKYNETSVAVQEIRREISGAQALLDKEVSTRTEVTTGINATYEEVNRALIMEMANFSSLESKAKILEAQLTDARAELKQFIETEVRIASLQRDLNLQYAKYSKYSENLEQARIDQALEMNKFSNISIVQQPTLSRKPVRPRKVVNLSLGLLIGILGGIGFAFFFERADHTFRKPEDVEQRLKLPLLAAIPNSKEKFGS